MKSRKKLAGLASVCSFAEQTSFIKLVKFQSNIFQNFLFPFWIPFQKFNLYQDHLSYFTWPSRTFSLLARFETYLIYPRQSKKRKLIKLERPFFARQVMPRVLRFSLTDMFIVISKRTSTIKCFRDLCDQFSKKTWHCRFTRLRVDLRSSKLPTFSDSLVKDRLCLSASPSQCNDDSEDTRREKWEPN